MNVLLVSVITLVAVAFPLVNGQCASLTTTLQFDQAGFFPNPGVVDYVLETELFLETGLAAVAEVHFNYSDAVAPGTASVSIEYYTNDTTAVGFTYDNATRGCEISPNNDVSCDLGKLGIAQGTTGAPSSSSRVSPAVALAAIALYTQDFYSILLAGVVAAPRLVAAQTCAERLIVTLTLADADNKPSITPSVLTDSIKFQAQCEGGSFVACFGNILNTCRVCA